jgi:cytochrome P450
MRWVTLTGQKSNVSQLTEFSEKQINDRLSGVTKPGEGRDFIDRLLELENKGKATRKDTFVACSSNIGAGSDTTAITISVMLALLYSHPDKLAALRKEIEDNRVQSGRKPSDPISFVDAQKLPYLQAVILETLRINAPVGVLLPRVVSAKSGGVQVAGQFFPLGSVLGINPWVIHYNKDIFGPDADLFRPERWMVSPEETARLESCFLGFGAGNRGCIGRNVNMLEMVRDRSTEGLLRILTTFDRTRSSRKLLAISILTSNSPKTGSHTPLQQGFLFGLVF